MNTAKGLDRLEELFHRALGLESTERARFIAELRACNPGLGAEVESLIAAHEERENFLDSPAFEVATELIPTSRQELQTGLVIDRYRILGSLGKGGMGEVYLAEDLRLDRKVVLKSLPSEFTTSKDRLRRFTLEAKAASALNHPGIITIYEICRFDDAHLIVMEFIEGQTLRQRLSQGRLKLPEMLDIAVQVAGALAAAHQAAIIHRDVKPENIMLRRDGYVKIIDFGLAKLPRKSKGLQPLSADRQVAAPTLTPTEPGTVLGTVSYMSPEQARGRDIDTRTDIFSLGIVIYEMASGHRPFQGDTSLDVMVSILEKEPLPIGFYGVNVPAELQRIVSKALNKDRDERYQTIKDLLIDLRVLKEEIAFQAKRERSNPRGRGARDYQFVQAAEKTIGDISGMKTGRVGRADPLAANRKRRFSTARFGAVTALIVLAAGLALYWPRANPPPVPSANPDLRVSYAITVQKYRGDRPYEEPFRLRDDMNFERDYRIRLSVSSPQTGYLYLLNEGPGGGDRPPSFNVLFPSETANGGSARVREDQPVRIPEQSWFEFDAERGTEKIWLVWAAQSIAELEPVNLYANPKDRGEIKDPQMNASLKAFLNAGVSLRVTVNRDEERKETLLQATGDILVYAIKLEHH